MNHQAKLRFNRHARRRKEWTSKWPHANTGPFYDFYSGGELILQAAHAKRMISRDDAEKLYWLKPGTLSDQ